MTCEKANEKSTPRVPREQSSPIRYRDPIDNSVLVLDGYGVSISVHRGHLRLEDGIGRHRRERRLPRAQRTVTRIVILGHTGHLTLEATRWCQNVGITVVQLDARGHLILSAGANNGRNDPRLRRSQAAAPGSPIGAEIARTLLGAKITGQAANLERHQIATSAAVTIRELAERLDSQNDLLAIADLEARASNIYFGAWAGRVRATFAERDRDRMPAHWATFVARGSILSPRSRSPRAAADPINALLNYGYAIAETECQLALQALGLDAGLGIMHTDKPNRDSLALDLLEPIRPIVDDRVLQFLNARRFTRHDLAETAVGQCRLLPPITHQLAGYIPYLAREIAPHAESIAHAFATASPSPIQLRTPLTRASRVSAQTRGARSANRRPRQKPEALPTCRTCGVDLTDPKRQLCPTCWPATRRRLASRRAIAGAAALEVMRARGADPTNTPDAAAKRSRSLRAQRLSQREWTPSPEDASWTRQRYLKEILPGLAKASLSDLRVATGLSVSACSRIRSGKLIPHQRHWFGLNTIASGSSW